MSFSSKQEYGGANFQLERDIVLVNRIYKEILHGSLEPAEVKLHPLSSKLRQEVFVTPAIIEVMLHKYITDVVNDQQLSDWAAFLISHDVYVTENWEDDAQADKYEPMWEILQQLSTPFIDGPITKDRVEGYICQLSSIESS